MINVINLKDEMYQIYSADLFKHYCPPKNSTRKIILHEDWKETIFVTKHQTKKGKYLFTEKDHMLRNEVLDEYIEPNGIIFKNGKQFWPYAAELIDERHELYQRISRTAYNDIDIHIETGKFALKDLLKPHTTVHWKFKRSKEGKLVYLSEKMVVKGKLIKKEENIIYPEKNQALHIQKNSKGFEEVNWISIDEVCNIKETEELISFLYMLVKNDQTFEDDEDDWNP